MFVKNGLWGNHWVIKEKEAMEIDCNSLHLQ